MDVIANGRDRWSRALEDAGYAEEDGMILFAEHRVESPREFMVSYLGPQTLASDSPVPLTDPEIASLDAERSRHRVVVPRGLNPEIEMGLMRWALERARQFDENPAFLWFSEAINNAVHPRYGSVGSGSAVVWHTIPAVRDADSAAGYLVTNVFGEQIGQLHGTFGSLLRVDRPTPDPTTLAERLTIFAAIHAEDLIAWASDEQNLEVDQLLVELDPDAPAWWKALMEDDDFTHLRRSSPYYVPTTDDIDAVGENAGVAWRPLQRHLDITAERGAAVLAMRAVGT